MTFPLFKVTRGKPEIVYSIGAPYHGLTLEGTLDLSGSGGPVLTGFVDSSMWNVSLSNPNRTLPTRTGPEITADAAVGREHRDYALAPSHRVFGLNAANLSLDGSVYFDSRGYTWLVDWSGLFINVHANTITGDVVFTRFMHVGDVADSAPITETVSFSSMGLPGAGPTLSSLGYILDQKRDGSAVLFTGGSGAGHVVLYGVWEFTITDTIDEGGVGTPNPYPYGGGTIAFNISASVYKSYADCLGTITYTFALNHEVADYNETIIPFVGTPDNVDNYCQPPVGVSGANVCFLTTTSTPDVDSGTFTGCVLSANYDTAGAKHVWTYDSSCERTTSYNFTGGGSSGDSTNDITETMQLSFTLKLDGSAVDSKSVTAVRSYLGTYHGTGSYSDRQSSVTLSCSGFTDHGSALFTDTGGGFTWTSYIVMDGGNALGMFGNLSEFARRIDVLGEEPFQYAPFLPFTGSTVWAKNAYEEFYSDDPDNVPGFQVGVSAFGGNKAWCTYSFDANYSYSTITSNVNILAYVGVVLDTFYSAESSQVPDTTSRAPATSDWGTPVAYDPENDAWSVSSWDGTENRWQRRAFV